MANVIKFRRSNVTGKLPTVNDIELGEIAINTFDGKLFTLKDNGSVLSVAEIGAIANGDRGDITVSNSGGTWTIDAGAVTGTKIADNTITNVNISSSAAIEDSKLATISTVNKVSGSAINISGTTDIGADIVDDDYFIVLDTSTSANRKSAASRVATYVFGKTSGDITISSTGTSTLASTGVTAGTYTKVTVDVKGRVTTGSTLSASDIPTLTAAKISDFDTQVRTNRLDQLAAPTSSVSLNNQKITSLATPTADSDACTKAYADAIKQGLDIKDSVRVATTENITLSGLLSIDGVTVAVGNRVLVKNQNTGSENGIYTVSSGSWSRSTDADASSKVTAGMFVFVSEGTANADSGWVLTTNDAITLDTTALSFTQFSGAGQITAGDGLTKTGNTLNVVSANSGRITISADSIDLGTTGVSAGTYRSVTTDVYGRITAGTNPTTLAGYGITDAQPLDADLTAIAGLSGASGFLKKTAADAWALDTNTYLTGNQSISISGDATGSGTTSITLTLANSGVTAGTYNNSSTAITPITVDAKGRVTGTGASVTIQPLFSSIQSKPTSLSGYGITDAQPLDADLTAIAALAGTSGFLKKTAADTWALDTNTYLTGNQSISVSGDATGTGTTSITLTLANSGVTAGTYNNSATAITPITVDAKGRVTGTGAAVTVQPLFSSIQSKPTTLTGYGITDAATSTHVHGNITNAGAIGSTASLPIITGASGVLTTGSFGTTSGTFCQGNDSRLSDTRNTTNSITFNNLGAGGASGSAFNGSSALTVSYNTVGAPSTTGTNASGSWGISVTGSSASCTGNAATATTLQNARNINGTSFNGSADISATEWVHSDRDFPNGTLITTSIDYSVTNGDPFVLLIQGNSYGNIIPLDLMYQGYIYNNTIINHGGLSNGHPIADMVAINVGGKLCFWFPSQGYWNGYNVIVYTAYSTRAVNKVTSITGSVKPVSTKEVALSANIRQSLHSSNYNSYAPTLTGTGASGTWGINVTGSAGSAGSVSGLTLTSSSNAIDPNNVTQNQLGYGNGSTTSLFGQTDCGLYSSAYNSSWIHEIFGDFRTGQIAVRGKNNGTWQNWRAVFDSYNYSASSSWTPNVAGGVVRSTTNLGTFTKTSASGGWDAHVYSSEGYITNVYASASPGQVTAQFMFGLNSDPATNTSYDSIDYAFYFRSDGILEIYESSTFVSNHGSYTTTDVFSVVYDGAVVTYYKNNTAIRRVLRALSTSKLYFDSSFATPNGSITNVSYGTFAIPDFKPSNDQYQVNINAPDVVSGTWTSETGNDVWGNPKFDKSYNNYRWADAPAYVQYNIPSGMKSAWVSHLCWDTGGYVDIYGVENGGNLVFLRRINTRQTVENAGGTNHDGSTVTFAASGLDDYPAIRFTVKSGRFHMTGLSFSTADNEGTEGVGMVHPGQISHQGAGSGLDADLLDGLHASQFFNNMGNNHGTRQDFNSIANFGFNYVQGSTNGPGIAGAIQYYNLSLGLGNDYAYTAYAMEFAIPRTPLGGTPYPSVRFRENGAWGSWSKIYAGYADSAGVLTGGDSNFYGLLYNSISADLNTYNNPGLTSGEYVGSTNRPVASNGHFVQITDAGGTDVKTQWYFESTGVTPYMRLQWGNGVLRPWQALLTSGNYSASSSWTPIMTGGVTRSTTALGTFTKSTGNTAWDGQLYSSEGFNNSAYAFAYPGQVNANIMFGLNSDPTADASYASIDYAIFLVGDGNLYVYENGSGFGPYGTYATTDLLGVVCDGTNVHYLKNGTVFKTTSRIYFGTPSKLYFDSSFYTVGASLTNVSFGGATQAAAYATYASGISVNTQSPYSSATWYPVFASSPSSSATGLYAGGGLTYNPGSNTLSAGILSATSSISSAGAISGGQALFNYNNGVTGSTAPSYTQYNLQLYTASNNVPCLSFHRAGYSATALYEYDGQLYVNAWTTRAQTGLLLSSGNYSGYSAFSGAITGTSLTTTGNVTAYSDIRLKKNIKQIDNALEKVLQIRGVTFNRTDSEDESKKYTGVIAHEVEQVLPEAVEENEEGIKSVAYGNMVGLLIEAIKEQNEEIKKLKEELRSIRGN